MTAPVSFERTSTSSDGGAACTSTRSPAAADSTRLRQNDTPVAPALVNHRSQSSTMPQHLPQHGETVTIRVGLAEDDARLRSGVGAAHPTTGALSCRSPIEPKNGAFPKLNTPP